MERSIFGNISFLGYELNGVERVSWDARREEIRRSRLTPGTFNRPGWTLQVTGHAAVADFLDISL